MSDNEENERKMQEVLGRFCLINREFGRLICIGEGCGFAMDPCQMEDHLVDMHDVGKFTARRVTRSVSLSMAGAYREGIPSDGLEAQKGLAVFDGLRCARCGKCKTRVFGEVEKHWYDIGHGITKGSVVELVRLQSWGDRKGGQGGYWVVDEDKGGIEGEKEIMELRRMEGLVQTALNEVMGMGGPVDAPGGEAALSKGEAVEKRAEEVAKGVGEEMAEEVPEEVANIPDNSEGWSEEESGETSKKEEEEVGGKLYESRWKEAKYERYNDTRGDWVIMR